MYISKCSEISNSKCTPYLFISFLSHNHSDIDREGAGGVSGHSSNIIFFTIKFYTYIFTVQLINA